VRQHERDYYEANSKIKTGSSLITGELFNGLTARLGLGGSKDVPCGGETYSGVNAAAQCQVRIVFFQFAAIMKKSRFSKKILFFNFGFVTFD
jgi:hypothetical protein